MVETRRSSSASKRNSPPETSSSRPTKRSKVKDRSTNCLIFRFLIPNFVFFFLIFFWLRNPRRRRRNRRGLRRRRVMRRLRIIRTLFRLLDPNLESLRSWELMIQLLQTMRAVLMPTLTNKSKAWWRQHPQVWFLHVACLKKKSLFFYERHKILFLLFSAYLYRWSCGWSWQV